MPFHIIIGRSSFITGLVLIIEGNNNSVVLGENMFILDDTRFWVVDGSSLQIGKGCMLSDHIDIRTTDNHSIIDRETGKRINYEKDIILHDNVWVGTGVTILKGSEIADGCIIGAKSVITKKHERQNSIIVGNPGVEVKKNVEWKMERVRDI